MSDNIKKIKTFTKAVVKHAADGFSNVCGEEYAERMKICNNCSSNNKGICTECGCILSKKAWWRSEDCPKDKWPKQK